MNQQSLSFHDINSIVAVDAPVPEAGAIVWWRLSGRVDYDTFIAAWQTAGLALDDAPSSCSATTALRRACEDLRQKRMLVRPLGRDGGFAIVSERVVGGTESLKHDVLATITLDGVGRPKVESGPAASLIQFRTIEDAIKASFDVHMTALDSADFSSWLTRLMPKLDAVGLRDQGGVYFVPSYAVAKVAAAVTVLRAVTNHVVNRVPAMRSDDAVNAILDAVMQEAQAEATHLEEALEAGKLGERGLENRVLRCNAMDEKVTRYEALLGRKLEGLRDRLETIRANLTVAVLKSTSKEDVS